jgi:regulator of sigma E protease
MTAALLVILIISFLVLIHELGHFIAAKRAQVKVEEFGIGYPPRLLTLFTWQGTDFSLNLIPIGGFVRMAGEHRQQVEQDKAEQTDQTVEQTEQSAELKPNQPAKFYQKTAKQRLKVIMAGVAVNIIFAILAFSIVFSLKGIPVALENQARIGYVSENSPAAQAGLPTNVNIIEIKTEQHSYQINSIEQVQAAIKQHRGQTVTIITTGQCQSTTCPDSTRSFEVYARSPQEIPEGQGSIGIAFQPSAIKFYPAYQMPLRGTWYGIKQAVAVAVLILQALGQVVTTLITKGVVQEDVAGPVGIVYQAQQGNLISQDFLSNLGFAGMLSLNLGIMNLLPIPALDGGRALFIILEKIFNKKRVQTIEGYANYAGFALLILLIVAITIKDISQVLRGG